MSKPWAKRGEKMPPLQYMGSPIMDAIMAYANKVGEREKWRALAVAKRDDTKAAKPLWHAFYDAEAASDAMLRAVDAMLGTIHAATKPPV